MLRSARDASLHMGENSCMQHVCMCTIIVISQIHISFAILMEPPEIGVGVHSMTRFHCQRVVAGRSCMVIIVTAGRPLVAPRNASDDSIESASDSYGVIWGISPAWFGSGGLGGKLAK